MLKPKKGFLMAQLNIERLTPIQWDGIMRAMDAYAEHYHEEKIKLFRNDVSYVLNELKEKGYHRRVSNAMTISDVWMNCDCCGRKTKVKIGYEANYPKNVDMALCSMCSDELIDLCSK